jgi:integrase/recombinase XerD
MEGITMRKKTSKSIKYKGIRIRRRGRRWQVDYGMRNGRRIQRSFKSKVLAKGDVDEHLAHESPEQQDVREHAVTLSHLTQHERIDVLEAIDLLKGMASLREAATFFIAQHVGSRESHSVNELFAEYKEAKRKANCREWHLRTIEYRIGKFAEAFGQREVVEITADQVGLWLDEYQSNRGKALGPVSRNNFLAYLSAFFNFAVKKGYAAINPVEKIDRIHVDRPEIAILAPDDVRRLLCAARDCAPELVPYLAIAVFAGVRPTELQRLTWEHVNFDLHYIHIGGGISKVRNERYVDMEDVLIKWLEPYRQPMGPVVPSDTYTFNRLFNKVRREASLKDTWSPDSMRHTFASYHAARYERKDKTAMMMGNSIKMLDRHYRRPLHRSDTTEFWNISPERTT